MPRSFFDELAANYIAIPRARFVKEHVNLLKVLKKADPKQLNAEAKDQAEELKKVMKEGRDRKRG